MHKFWGVLSLSLQTFDENRKLSMTILPCTEHSSFRIHPNEIKLKPADTGDLRLQIKKKWLHLNQYCLSYLQFFSNMCRACWKNDISQKFERWSFSLQSDSISIIHVPAALEWPTPGWKNMQIKNECVEFEESWVWASRPHKISQFWRSETSSPAGPVLLV